jgi:hypothetical protein
MFETFNKTLQPWYGLKPCRDSCWLVKNELAAACVAYGKHSGIAIRQSKNTFRDYNPFHSTITGTYS